MTHPYGILTDWGWWVPNLPLLPPAPVTKEFDTRTIESLRERSDPSIWDTDALVAEVLDALDTD